MADATTKVVATASKEHISDRPHLRSWLLKAESINTKIRTSHTISGITSTFFIEQCTHLLLSFSSVPFPAASWLSSLSLSFLALFSPALGMIYLSVTRIGRRVATREVSCLPLLLHFKNTPFIFLQRDLSAISDYHIPAVIGRCEKAHKQLCTFRIFQRLCCCVCTCLSFLSCACASG